MAFGKSCLIVTGKSMPVGTCCDHYADGMCTLWSMIFDPADKVVVPNEPADTDFGTRPFRTLYNIGWNTVKS